MPLRRPRLKWDPGLTNCRDGPKSINRAAIKINASCGNGAGEMIGEQVVGREMSSEGAGGRAWVEIDGAIVVLVRWGLGSATQWTPTFRETDSDSESLAKCECQSLA